MAILEVNHNQINFESKEHLNLKSLIPKLQKKFPLESYTIENFLVNGVSIDINSEDPVLVRPIHTEDHIEINFNKNDILLNDIVIQLPLLLDKIIDRILKCASELKIEDEYKANISLTKAIEAVDTFIESMVYALKNSPNENDMINSLPVKELQIHLLSVLKAINTASSKDDTIMLTDLLEYELKDNLTQWKILIIPVLKQNMRELSISF
jgi:hypothetical protein